MPSSHFVAVSSAANSRTIGRPEGRNSHFKVAHPFKPAEMLFVTRAGPPRQELHCLERCRYRKPECLKRLFQHVCGSVQRNRLLEGEVPCSPRREHSTRNGRRGNRGRIQAEWVIGPIN